MQQQMQQRNCNTAMQQRNSDTSVVEARAATVEAVACRESNSQQQGRTRSECLPSSGEGRGIESPMQLVLTFGR